MDISSGAVLRGFPFLNSTHLPHGALASMLIRLDFAILTPVDAALLPGKSFA